MIQTFSDRIRVSMILLCLPALAHAQPHFEFYEPVMPPRPVKVMVHRGMKAIAPENSASAIELCASDFFEWAEIDVRLTKDGQHVVIHDDSVDSTTNGSGKVAEQTLDELKLLDAGTWFARRFANQRILTLAEALKIARGKVNLYLDCKQIDPELLVKEVTAERMQRQVIVYGPPGLLDKIKSASNGSVAGMTKYRPSMEFSPFVKQIAPAAVEIDADDVTPEICERFHAAGIKVQAKVLGEKWDNPEVWGRMIDARVDWLQTDDPVGIRFFDGRRRFGPFPVMMAFHRGANRYAPENTLPAIRHAARLGADFTEIDIRTTKDGHTILMHDGTVNRTTHGTGNVRDILYADAIQLSAGIWFGKPFHETRVPSFEQAMREFGPKMAAYLDAKDISPQDLLDAIEKHGFADRHVVYQSVPYCDALRKLSSKVRTLPPLKRFDQLDAVASIQPYGVDAAWSILSKDMIAECHRRNIKVFSDALGANETIDQYQKAIDWGIDCIQTDHPLRVLRAIELLSR